MEQPMSEDQIRQEIILCCERLYQRNMLAAGDGNVSYRISDERILITPTGVPKAFIKPEQIAVMNIKGELLEGKPSSERLMHLEVFRACKKARAVVHAHPPAAVAWSIARPEWTALPSECISEVILAVGEIPVVPYARPGTEAMGKNILPYLPHRRVFVLARHGALTWGESLQEGSHAMERLEHSAMILMYAQQMGGLTSLPAEEVQALKEMRQQLGEKSL